MSKKEEKRCRVTTRRQFLSLLGIGAALTTTTDPFSMMLRGIVDGLINDAQAAVTGAKVKNYVSILAPGAPARWLWDGFLNPNNETISKNNCVSNWLTTDRYIGSPGTMYANTEHRAERVNIAGFDRPTYLPPLWNRNMPIIGGTAPMHSLLNNTLIMRGVDMQIDLGHDIGPAKVLFPVGADASLTGLVADSSSKLIPMVGMRAGLAGSAGSTLNYGDPVSQAYKSLKGVAPTLINSTDPINATLSSFVNQDATVLGRADQLNSPAVKAAMKSAMDQLGAYSKSSLPGADELYKNANSAMDLFQKSFGNLTTIYEALRKKYDDLIVRCARTAIPNILPANGDGGYNLAGGGFSRELAAQFAVTEYLLVNGYSSAITMTMERTSRIAGLISYNDEHFSTAYQPDMTLQRRVVNRSFQFLVLSTMLYELRKVLIANNLWTDTVIHISSEFGRSPRDDGTGSDHSSSSNAITVMSGAITKPILIGNIKYESSKDPIYKGTWGAAAPVATSSGSVVITNAVAAATVASLLGVQPPVSTAKSLISVNGTSVTSLAEPPKNIA